MATNVAERIFDEKKALEELYPHFPGIKSFDIEKKHMLLGRIDKKGDAVYIDSSNLKQVPGSRGSTHLAVDFVSAAFSDLQSNIKSAAEKGFISKNSIYPSKIKATRSWATGDLEFSYNQYLNKLYTTFVDSYLSVDRRADKITNFKDFVKEFMFFALRTIKYFPITKTGYITSIHCSPFVSGLMLEVTSEQHKAHDTSVVRKYIDDVNFAFFVKEARKFGFMVDKNAPWRLVFNIASGMLDKAETGELTGAQRYMDNFAVSYENLFETYYHKAYLNEFTNLKNKLYSLYEAYYFQFSTYETLQYLTDPSGRCRVVKLVNERHDREPPTLNSLTKDQDEYWLKLLMKVRMSETGFQGNPKEFAQQAAEMIRIYRIFSLESALKHINDLTKGMPVTTFLSKGRYWYGLSEKDYLERKLSAIDNANDPVRADYSLTSSKNTK